MDSKRSSQFSKLRASFWHFYRRIEAAELDLIAAGVAFYAFLAIFPAAAAIITIWSAVADPNVIRQEIALVARFIPAEVYSLLQGQIAALMSMNTSSLGVTTLLSTLFALWSARAGVAALMRGLNAIHHLPNRAGHWHQIRAILLTLVLIALILSVLFMAIAVPVALAFLPINEISAQWLNRSNLALGTGAAILAVGLAYRMGPNFTAKSKPPLLSWGLLVAVVLWVAATRGFVFYLGNFAAYNQIYGSIGAVVAMLIWLYISAYAVLLGAAVDAERARKPRA
jgi:membrane protein